MGFISNLFGRTQNVEPERRTVSAIYFENEPSYSFVDVVGESHFQRELRIISGRQGAERVAFEAIAVLVPKMDDRADPNAVSVQIEGHTVGFLRYKDSPEYRPAVDAAIGRGKAIACDCEIRSPDDAQFLGVGLYLPDPDDLLAGIAEALAPSSG